ncbi:guanine deaminase [Arthrobacter ginsengisoli]|uniref:Guanine deaminase n=1 Tax=Arthrobacter ginsengisoli TaxID=1356565 RepID=A0ABU1U8G3_9MICC|nr:nucleoside deaminase [Arthrobacter ginsengisoli]MDR7081473.1 guanine deaminase [Arthrobacter ginsengisoli]
MATAPSALEINRFLDQAVRLAAANVDAGGGPFGALVVTSDGRIHEGVNHVTRDNDPTAHAEVVAIRAAAAASANFDLSGSVLYASCEPCPLCLAAALWARVDRVYFAADRHAAAAAGFDDALFYEYFEGTQPDLMPVRHTAVPASGVPFVAWRDNPDRVEY